MMQSLVFATRNKHKARELAAIVAPYEFTVDTLDAVAPHAPAVEETGSTFIANAALKALSAYRVTGRPSVADDSGLCVDALDGGPGVFSARYAGPQCDDDANNARLVADMAGRSDRGAHYTCALALVLPSQAVDAPAGVEVHHDYPGCPENAMLVTTEAHVRGEIIDTPRGSGGFGYDPYFYVPQLGCTFAESAPEQKHALSHRGRAFRRLASFLESLTKGQSAP